MWAAFLLTVAVSLFTIMGVHGEGETARLRANVLQGLEVKDTCAPGGVCRKGTFPLGDVAQVTDVCSCPAGETCSKSVSSSNYGGAWHVTLACEGVP